MATLTVPELEVTIFPPISWILTDGCFSREIPDVVTVEGCEVRTTFVACPIESDTVVIGASIKP